MSTVFHILIVDDNETQRYSLRKTLQRDEYHFLEAHNAAEALDVVRREKPDIVLLDVRLPGIDGFDVCEAIRAFDAHTPVVFVTANVKTFIDQVKGFEKGGDDYVIQPYDPQELAIKVKALLRNKRLFDHLKMEVEKLAQMREELASSNDELKQINNRLAEKNEHLSTLAITDPLTSLYNRKYFHSRISKEISAVKRYKHFSTAMIIDIDNFTEINARYGTKQGDVILKEFASLLINRVRNSDVVTRFDGGKFCIILTHTSEENGVYTANLIQEAIRHYPFPIYEDLVPTGARIDTSTPIQLTASIVVAGLMHDWIRSEADLIASFEKSLARIKPSGSGQIVVGSKD